MDVILAATFAIFVLSMIFAVVIERLAGVSGPKSTAMGLAIFLIAISVSAWPIYTKSENQSARGWWDSRVLLFSIAAPVEGAFGHQRSQIIIEDLNSHRENFYEYYWEYEIGARKRGQIDSVAKEIYLHSTMLSLTVAFFLFMFALRRISSRRCSAHTS
tara:strand:- start:456 stop:932 length:477 start_codon:yes stop_codon:yes gene_type:complete